MTSRFFFFILLLLAISCQENVSSKDVVDSKANSNTEIVIHQHIDSLLYSLHSKAEFNGNVLVSRAGKKLHFKSYGYADSSKQILLENNYRFGIGSIFKEFPAVSIMKLKESGALSLDDKINKFLPELPSWSHDISILNLLQYTSGLPMIDWNKYFSNDEVVSDEGIMNDIMNIEALEFKPGSDYLYSNNSPFLLIKIIEEISKQDFGTFTKVELFQPLGMTGIELKYEYPYLDRTAMAMPISEKFDEDVYKISTPKILFTASLLDLDTWFSALNLFKVINKESMVFLAETADLDIENMQAPLGNCDIEESKIIEHLHHGSMGNYECLVRRFNEEDVTIVILTNQKNKNVFEISDAILSLIEEKK